MPTRVNGGTVATLSVANPESEKVSAAAGSWTGSRTAAITPTTASRYLDRVPVGASSSLLLASLRK